MTSSGGKVSGETEEIARQVFSELNLCCASFSESLKRKRRFEPVATIAVKNQVQQSSTKDLVYNVGAFDTKETAIDFSDFAKTQFGTYATTEIYRVGSSDAGSFEIRVKFDPKMYSNNKTRLMTTFGKMLVGDADGGKYDSKDSSARRDRHPATVDLTTPPSCILFFLVVTILAIVAGAFVVRFPPF